MRMYFDYDPHSIEVYERGTRLKLCPDDAASELFGMSLIRELLQILDSTNTFDIQRQQQWKAVSRRLKKAGWRLPNRWIFAINSFCSISHYVWISHLSLPNIDVKIELDGPYVESIRSLVYRR